MAKSHTILGCVTLLLTTAAPLAAQASSADDGGSDNPLAVQHSTYLPFKAVGVLSGVALFTALLKAHDNSAAPSHAPALAAANGPSNGPSVVGQNGSDDADDNGVGGPDKRNGDDNDAATVPEPGTLVLVASGLLGIAGVRRRRWT